MVLFVCSTNLRKYKANTESELSKTKKRGQKSRSVLEESYAPKLLW